jgi:ERF superfamily protein
MQVRMLYELRRNIRQRLHVTTTKNAKLRKNNMSQSECIHELAAALSKAQGEMQAAIKDKVNPFYKSSYADLGSVWDAARPVLSKNGLCIMQTTEMTTTNQIIMVTTLAHTSGQWVKSYLPLNPNKPDSQGIGAAITYLRRYSLSALVGVVCDNDDDGETAVGRGKTQQAAKNDTPPKQDPNPEPPAVPVETIDQGQIDTLKALVQHLDEPKSFFDWIKKSFNSVSLESIPKNNFGQCVASLHAKIKFLKSEERGVA